MTKFKNEMKREPTNYAITAYDAVLVDRRRDRARRRQAASRSPAAACGTRSRPPSCRPIQGPIAFDENGDILTRTVSIYQWRDGEIKYVGVAPEK